ncbi:MAG: putative signal peptide peptidase SppA [Candidatus Anoxychlamydiales bacterium]|nr:putative signal peptide peptidase SppA [Candidatus Anoxychlamydiales bacterium]
MEISRESIFISSIRVFFNTFFAIIAVAVAVIPIIIISLIFSTPENHFNLKNKLEILPDLEGNTKILPMSTPCVLRVDIKGEIGKQQVTSEDIYYQLIESRKGRLKHNRVKAILLNVNSGGGHAIVSDIIYRNLISYKEKFNVPIYTYIEGVCASGGYYIACSSDKIYSTPLGMTGSVGVFFGPFFNFKKLMDKVGVNSKTISDGENKLTLNPFDTWTEDEGKYLQSITNYTYDTFLNIVASSRKIDKEKLINDYGAKVFNTKEALKIQYIDKVSSYNEALEDLLKEANIDTQKPYQVVTLKSKKAWLHPMLQSSKVSFKSFLKEYLITLIKN